MELFNDYTGIFNAFIAFLSTILTYYILPLIKALIQEKRASNIGTWVSIAVTSAEQICNEKEGQLKMEYVTNFLNDLKINVTIQEIESAVFLLNHQFSELLDLESDV